MRMNDIVGYARNGEVADNTNAKKYKVTRIGRAKESITGALDLANIKLEHLLLHLSNDTAEYVSDRQPKEDIDIPGNPLRQSMLQAVKDGKAE